MNPVPKPRQQPKPLPGFIPKVNAKRAAIRKARDFGSIAEWLRTLPCCVSGLRTGDLMKDERFMKVYEMVVVESAHVQGRGAGGRSENNQIPLARPLHRRQHAKGWEAIGLTRAKAQQLATDYQVLFNEKFGP